MGFWNLVLHRTPHALPPPASPPLTAPASPPHLEPPVISGGLLQIPPGWDHTPPAHLKFLCTFLNGGVFAPDSKSYWAQVLGEAPAASVHRFLAAGLIVPASLASKLSGSFTANELKAFLRARGLPVSGTKANVIERLIAADPVLMEAKVANVTAYICTPAGKLLAEQYIAAEEERTRIAHERSLQYLQAGDMRKALAIVFEYESKQVFPRGIGCDWNRTPDRDDVARVQAVLNIRPKILRSLPGDQWGWAVYAAAMQEMWGERSAREWLPPTFTGVPQLGPETTVRMVAFAGSNAFSLAQMHSSGIKRVRICGGDDSRSCPGCRKVAARSYRISEVPELPFEDCTSSMGCRCCYVADL